MISTPSSSMADGKPFIGTYVHETPLNSSITVHFTVNPPPVTDITEEARPRVIGPQYVETQRPKVVIVGGSIGGLALGVLLQKAGVEFRILERSTVFDHAETAIFLNSTTHKFLLQIGAWEEISQYAKPTQTIVVANEDRKVEYTLEFRDQVKLIDKENIVMGKRVLSYIPGNRYVIVKCATGDHITCDILVGADGVFSAVRQNLYAELATKGALPSEDSEEVALSTVSLVGQTIPLDSSFYPGLNDEHCQFVHVIGKNKPYTVSK
ncbi:hypothetical protein FBU30_003000 [Linnemannia zychae]|nr:hypothetical protein FBU30_003000 [Linnemannia zychae]